MTLAGVAPAEFPEYSSSYSTAARKSRENLPADLYPLLEQIEQQLADGPERLEDRLIPASLEGTTYIYSHSDPPLQITFQVDKEKKVVYYFHFSAPALKVVKTVFISYSHADEKWLRRVKRYLSVLEQQGLIRFWDDSQIEAGEEWRQQIESALDSARAAVLLVSPDFLTSKFITEYELPRLLADSAEQGKKVFWIPVRQSTVFETHEEITDFESPLKNPRTSLADLSRSKLETALLEVSARLAKAVAG